MIEFLYSSNEWMVSWHENGGGGAGVALIASTVVLYGWTFAALGMLFYYFGGCSVNDAVTSITLIIVVVVTAMSLLHPDLRNESAGLLTAALVSGYCAYLNWSAASSEPVDCVSHVFVRGNKNGATDIIAIAVMLLIVAVACLSSSREQKAFDMSSGDEANFVPALSHSIFALSSMYVAMLFTGWETKKALSNGAFDVSWWSVWVKLSTLYLCAGLYIWTLVAPRLLQDRF